MKPTTLSMAAISLAGCMLAVPAQAAYTWNFSGSNATSGTAGNTKTLPATTAGAPTLNAKAYSNTGTSSQLATAYLGAYGGGLGVTSSGDGSGSSDRHTMDNSGSTDSILFDFGSTSVILDKISVGYVGTSNSYESDISLLRYTGTGVPPSLTGKTYSDLLSVSNGWEVIGNYTNTGVGTADVNAAGKSSSYWLVAAYNAAFGSTCMNSTGGPGSCDTSKDGVKISALTTADPVKPPTQPVPEPTTLLLFGAGLLGLIKARRT